MGGLRKTDSFAPSLQSRDESGASMSIENLLKGYKKKDCTRIMKEILCKYRSYASVEEIALQMVEDMNMTSTSVSEKIFTTGYDLNKFYFTLNNGGKYAGRQVLSPKAAEIVLKSL